MRRISVPGIVALLCVAAGPTPAQTADTAASAPSARAQRDAEKVFRWIRLHSDKPRRWGDNKDTKETPVGRAVATATPARPAPTAAEPAAVAPAVAAPVPAMAAAGPAAPALDAAPPASAPALLATTAPVPVAPLVGDPPVPAPAAASAPDPEPDEEPLILMNQVEPRFSSQVMQSLRKGSVQVRFEVRPDGSVGQAEVVRSSSARLNGAALAAVWQWRFQPLRRAQSGLVDLAFNLD